MPRFQSFAIVVAILIHASDHVRANEEFPKLAVAEARKSELRPNNSLDLIKRSMLMVRAASLEIEHDRDAAVKWLDEAEKLLAVYDFTGKELVPIVFPMFRQAITTGTSEEDFSQLARIVSGKDGLVAFQFIVERLGQVNPDLTLQMIEKACPEESRENFRLAVISGTTKIDPERALRLLAELPPVQRMQMQFRRAGIAAHAVAAARAAGVQQVAKPVEMLVTCFAPLVFAEAGKRGLRGEFSLQTVSIFGVAWFHLDPEAATPHLNWLTTSVKPARISADAVWKDRWTLQFQTTRDQVTLAGLHQVLGDRSAADAAFAEAVAGSALLVKLTETQPERQNGRYSFTFGKIATWLPRLSVPMSERIVAECQHRTDVDSGDDFILELISCTADRDRAVELTGFVSSPDMKARAYLLIAARSVGRQ
jgi:hypothetical protein